MCVDEPATRKGALDPARVAAMEQQVDLLPDVDKAIVIGLMATNPEAAELALERFVAYNETNDVLRAWIDRQVVQLISGKKHKPVQAVHVGKAMLVRALVDVVNKDAISKPDIFGVFASQAASGVLDNAADYDIAVACASGKGRSKSANRASAALTNPLKLLMSKALVERADIGTGVRIAKGCEKIFGDPRIKWPPPRIGATYVEPKPRLATTKRRR